MSATETSVLRHRIESRTRSLRRAWSAAPVTFWRRSGPVPVAATVALPPDDALMPPMSAPDDHVAAAEERTSITTSADAAAAHAVTSVPLDIDTRPEVGPTPMGPLAAPPPSVPVATKRAGADSTAAGAGPASSATLELPVSETDSSASTTAVRRAGAVPAQPESAQADAGESTATHVVRSAGLAGHSSGRRPPAGDQRPPRTEGLAPVSAYRIAPLGGGASRPLAPASRPDSAISSPGHNGADVAMFVKGDHGQSESARDAIASPIPAGGIGTEPASPLVADVRASAAPAAKPATTRVVNMGTARGEPRGAAETATSRSAAGIPLPRLRPLEAERRRNAPAAESSRRVHIGTLHVTISPPSRPAPSTPSAPRRTTTPPPAAPMRTSPWDGAYHRLLD